MSDREEPQTIVVNAEQYRQDLIRDSREEAARLRLDETFPGGRYRQVGNDTDWFDANGNVIVEGKAASAAAEDREALLARIAELEARAALIPAGADLEPALGQADLSDEARAEILKAAEDQQSAGTVDESKTVQELREQADRDGIELSGVTNKDSLVARMNETYAERARGAS